MRFVALLRGINVGGANKISMAELKACFEAAGMHDVRTYINSGNVVFTADVEDRAVLGRVLRHAIVERTGFDVDLQLRDRAELSTIAEAIPDAWTNGASMKCDVVFLQADVNRAGVIDELGPRPGIEDALYVSGAVIWRVDRANATRSRLTRIVGTPLYARVTVRNCNTVRKLRALLEE